MIYFCEPVTESGSFAPCRQEDYVRVNGKDAVADELWRWCQAHDRVGADSQDCSIRVYRGVKESSQNSEWTFGEYPDFEVKQGPRGGVVWLRC